MITVVSQSTTSSSCLINIIIIINNNNMRHHIFLCMIFSSPFFRATLSTVFPSPRLRRPPRPRPRLPRLWVFPRPHRWRPPTVVLRAKCMGNQLGDVSRPMKWSNIYRNKHPQTNYFRVPRVPGVLTHSPMRNWFGWKMLMKIGFVWKRKQVPGVLRKENDQE